MVVDRRVPAEARRAQLAHDPPAEPDDQPRGDARPRKPRGERARSTAQDQSHADRQRRQEGAEGILRQRGQGENRQAAGAQPAPAVPDPDKAEREAPGERGDEQRLGSDVAAVREELEAGQEGQAGHQAATPAEQARAEPGGRADGGERGTGGHGARRRLARAHDAGGGRDQHVEERRLVHVADTVQCQSEGVSGRGQLSRDLGVHPLARIVEWHTAQTSEEERRRDECRQHRRVSRRQCESLQVRETRNTPTTISAMPAQRVGVTASASRSRARSATTT